MGAIERNAFLADRRTGLGASDVAAVLGYSQHKTQVQIFLEKTGQADDDYDSMRLRFGRHNEDFVAREYSIVTGRAVQRYNPMLRHPDYPCILGHVDRLTIPEGKKIAAYRQEIRTDRGLEAKTVDPYVFRYSGEWGEPGTDEVPAIYLIQSAIYIALTGCPRWDLAALIGSGAAPLAIYHIVRDRDLEDELLRRAAEWWQRHVVAGVAPDPVNEEDVALLYPQAKAKQKPVVATEEILYHVARLNRCKKAEKHLERIQSEHAMVVKAFMGPADTLLAPEVDGQPGDRIATWGNRKGRSTFDLDTFVGHLCPGANPNERALFIEDAKRTFTSRGEPGRTFLLK